MTTLSKQLSDKTEFQADETTNQDRRHLAGLLR
jgi:hypothetical protein